MDSVAAQCLIRSEPGLDLDNGVWGMPRIVGLNLFKCYGSKLQLDVPGVDVQAGPERRLRFHAGRGDEFLGPLKVFLY